MRPPRWAQRLTEWITTTSGVDLAALRRSLAERADHWRTYLEGTPEIDGRRRPMSWLRPKGNLSRGGLLLLLLIALGPLLIMIARISAWPGVLSPGMAGTLLPSIGHELNEHLSLRNISSADREHVLYVLFVPTGVVLLTLARLTFGVRLIGFRAILISVGLQQSGILPSMVLIGVMVFVVVAIRPLLVGMRLPYYARLAVIMSVAAAILVCALLLAPSMRSEMLWRVAFFPVIVLGLLSEGIARTIDRDSGLAAFWRTAMTIGVALLLAGISHLPGLREVAIEFPELVLTQIVVIILIAEFLDRRLLQDWDATLSGTALPRLFATGSGLRIAVVTNRSRSGIIARLGVPSRGGHRRRSVRRIVRALRDSGHTVELVEGDTSLLSRLRAFVPPHAGTGEPGGVVFNLAHGIQGNGALAHVPAMLEMAGVAYTGPDPLGHLCALDHLVMKSLLREAGVPTPECRLIEDPADECRGLHYPVIVWPRADSGRRGRIAQNRQQLLETVRHIRRSHGQACVVEPHVAGREIEVPILGNAMLFCLPLVEVRPGGVDRQCPAQLDAGLASGARAAALAAYQACRARDYAIVTLRLAPAGEPMVCGIRTDGVLEEGGPFDLAAAAAGWTFAELVNRIVAVARERYRPARKPAENAITPVHDSGGVRKRGTLIAR